MLQQNSSIIPTICVLFCSYWRSVRGGAEVGTADESHPGLHPEAGESHSYLKAGATVQNALLRGAPKGWGGVTLWQWGAQQRPRTDGASLRRVHPPACPYRSRHLTHVCDPCFSSWVAHESFISWTMQIEECWVIKLNQKTGPDNLTIFMPKALNFKCWFATFINSNIHLSLLTHASVFFLLGKRRVGTELTEYRLMHFQWYCFGCLLKKPHPHF